MKQILIIGCLLGIFSDGFCQTKQNIEFIDYRNVIKDIYSSASISDVKNKWDYESVLLLDTAEIKRINKIRPDIVQDFKDHYHIPIPERYKKIIPTDIKSIKDFFTKDDLFEYLLKNGLFPHDSKNTKLKSPVYIKDNKIAVYEIYGHGWSDCYRMKIIDQGIIMELLYQVLE